MIFSPNKAYIIFPMDTIVLFAITFLLVSFVGYIVFRKRLKGKRMKVIGIWLGVWLLFGCVLFWFGAFGKFVDPETIHNKEYTKEELTQDLQELEKHIFEENPLYFSDRAELKELFDNAYNLIEDGMTELEFYRLINPLVAAVNCGHTNLSISKALLENRKETAKFFPLKVTLVNHHLYVLEDDPSTGIAAGDEILSINGKTSEEIISILINNTSGDGDYESKRRYLISKHFNSKFYDFVDSSDKFEVVLIGADGQTKQAELLAKARNEFNTTAWDAHFVNIKDGNYYDSEIYKDYAVLTIKMFANENGNKFDAFLNDFFEKLKAEKIDKLIIDLRGNFGGDSFMAKELLSYLTTKKFDYLSSELPFYYRWLGFTKPVTPKDNLPNLDVVVLTDGAVFSTAAHFTALMKYHQLGTIVGSETGGTYICTDGSKDVALKNTRLRLHYSTQLFQVKVQGMSDNNGIIPDIEVRPTIEDILKNKDVVMEKGVNQFK